MQTKGQLVLSGRKSEQIRFPYQAKNQNKTKLDRFFVEAVQLENMNKSKMIEL